MLRRMQHLLENTYKEWQVMNSKVLLTTVFSGYNYGSSLQALAGKTIMKKLGYKCELVAQKSMVKGRDIRLGKLLTILTRSLLLRGKSGSKALSTYQGTYHKTMIGDSAERFARFTEEILQPKYLSWSGLKRMANECTACFAGSDQIWNSSTMYVDPMYYLRFAPADKRVAFAPSFGRDFIADYNEAKMSKWIGEFASLSVREDSGVKLIKELTGNEVQHLLDPTLIVNAEEWKEILGIAEARKNYILAYFLDAPSDLALQSLQILKENLNCEVVAIPYQFDKMDYCDRTVAAGPKEFVELVANAKVVCTDSFHGTVFALNMHTSFFTFEREYGSANKQSERVLSILRKVGMLERYQPKDVAGTVDDLDFAYSDEVLDGERRKAYSYVENAINSIKRHHEE